MATLTEMWVALVNAAQHVSEAIADGETFTGVDPDALNEAIALVTYGIGITPTTEG